MGFGNLTGQPPNIYHLQRDHNSYLSQTNWRLWKQTFKSSVTMITQIITVLISLYLKSNFGDFYFFLEHKALLKSYKNLYRPKISQGRLLNTTGIIKIFSSNLRRQSQCWAIFMHNQPHSSESQVILAVVMRKILLMNYLIGFNKAVYS